MIRIAAAIFPVLFFAGCISQQPVPAVDRSSSPVRAAAQPAGPGYYTVKRGDTLYRIALENGQDHRDIATWNNIANPSAIANTAAARPNTAGTDSAVPAP